MQVAVDVDALQRHVAYLEEVVESQKRVIHAEREKRKYYEAVLRNKALPINMRLATIAAKTLEETRLPDENGFYRAHLPALAETVGVSPSTMSRALKGLADATQAVEHRTEPDKDEPYKSIVYIKPTERLDRPQELAPLKEIKRHGGDHRIARCNGCGSEHIVETKKWVCADCGQVHKEFEPRLINPPEEIDPLHDAMGTADEAIASQPDPLQDAISPVDTRVSDCNGLPPAELRALPIWCPWRYEPQKDKQGNIVPGAKPKKVPYQVGGRAPQKAESDNPATWATYEQAQHAYEEAITWNFREKYEGIGFMCDGSFVGIDLDHCRNKETGEIVPWAQAIIDRFRSYGYVTPSQEGVRLVIQAKKPGTRCKKGDIEVYEERRFFTWTPAQLPGTPETIEARQAELDALYQEVFPADPPALQVDLSRRRDNFTCARTDEEIVEKARSARNGAKFRALYDEGSIAGYPSPSEADQALCVMLAYWTDSNVPTIDRLFRQSRLYREKWDRAARSGETYGEGTIRRALGEREAVA